MQHDFFKKQPIIKSVPYTAQFSTPELSQFEFEPARENIPPPAPSVSRPSIFEYPKKEQANIPKLPAPPIHKIRQDLDGDLVKRTSLLRLQQTQVTRSPIPDVWTRPTASSIPRPVKSEMQAPSPIVPLSSIASSPIVNTSSSTSSKQSSYTTASSKLTARDNNENDSPLTKKSLKADPQTPSMNQEKSKTSAQSMEQTYINISNAFENRGKPDRNVYEKSWYESPDVFIIKWIDYCNKYGLGYQLCDGSVGVYFNDSTSIIQAADNLYSLLI